MTNPISREKCLELAVEHEIIGGFCTCEDCTKVNDRVVRFVRASVALGMEMAAKECDELADYKDKQAKGALDGRYDWMACGSRDAADGIRKLAEEVQRGE